MPVGEAGVVAAPAADRRWMLAAGFWTAVIVLGCLIPGRHLPIPETHRGLMTALPHWDKVAHAILFGAFAVLWSRALSPRRGPAIVLAGLALIALTELGQALPWVARDADLADALADLLGLTAGIILARFGGGA